MKSEKMKKHQQKAISFKPTNSDKILYQWINDNCSDISAVVKKLLRMARYHFIDENGELSTESIDRVLNEKFFNCKCDENMALEKLSKEWEENPIE